MSFANGAVLRSVEGACIRSAEGAVQAGGANYRAYQSIRLINFKNLCAALDLNGSFGGTLEYRGNAAAAPQTVQGVWTGVASGVSGLVDVSLAPTCTGNPLDPPFDDLFPDALSRQWGPVLDVNLTEHYIQLITNGAGVTVPGGVSVIMLSGRGSLDAIHGSVFPSTISTEVKLTVGAVSVSKPIVPGDIEQTLFELCNAANASSVGDFALLEFSFRNNGDIVARRIDSGAPVVVVFEVVPGVIDPGGAPDNVTAATDFDGPARGSDLPLMRFEELEDVVYPA